MSKSPEMVDCRRHGKAPADRSSFSRTCNLLSQILKERRNIVDVNGVFTRNPQPQQAKTMDLIRIIENPDEALKQNSAVTDFLPQYIENDSNPQPNSRTSEPGTQMTIFYAGRVLVFDNFQAEKATEIMELASKLNSDTSGLDKTHPSPSLATNKSDWVKEPQTNNGTAQELPQQGSQVDLRIARRASLNKFFEKRKERVSAKAPYQVNSPVRTSSNPSGSGSGIEPEDHDHCPEQLELKL